MVDLGHVWGLRLAGALRKWCDQHACYPRNKLATELGIGVPQWTAIITGNSVVEKADPTVYARLFLRTGLEEADPRSISPRDVRLPKGGFIAKERAWTEEKWQEWLAAQRRKKFQGAVSTAKDEPAEEELGPVATTPVGAQQSVGMLLGTFVDGLLAALSTQLGREIASLLAEQVAARMIEEIRLALRHEPQQGFKGARVSSESLHDIGQIAQRLYAALQPAFSGNPEERDELMQRHGKSLVRLLPVIEVLTRPQDDREEGIRVMQEVEL